MKETDLQFHIKKSVVQQGGYCKKLTNRFTIGIPDLLIALPPFAPCVCEVKEMGEVPDKFDRLINISPKQLDELRRVNEGYLHLNIWLGFTVVGIVHKGERRLVALPWHNEKLHSWYETQRPWVPRDRYNSYDIRQLMEGIGVAKVRDPMEEERGK